MAVWRAIGVGLVVFGTCVVPTASGEDAVTSEGDFYGNDRVAAVLKGHAELIPATFDAFDNQTPYGNTCDLCPDEVDSGVGLSWEFSIGRGDSKTKTLRTRVVIDD